ncbi:serine/threonine-protein kinase [Kitasatospora sp. NPDC085879]|uniref:serine/threonine-protein kinase n=1 Tax=Kitasatospora sp. NPDC085879 TaxID=3154769 RepID=UPI00343F9C9D
MDENRGKGGPEGQAPQDAAVPQDARWELPGYTHERELGAGAAGRVVLARHDATGMPVAVKYLNGEHADHENFRTEAELLAGLDSPHVTRLYEYVEGPRGAAIVMELVDGVSLRDLLQAEGATGPEAALAVLKGSLLGLADAHGAGVVHRDYKPGNVLVTTEGVSKLVDFGIAVPTGAKGDIAGTPAYMAPEQWTGEPASPRGDVYAATATFFECLTGAKPYAGTTLMELAVQHTEADIPDDQAPEALRPLIRSGLAKTPTDRPDGAADLVAELDAVASGAYGPEWEERGRRQLAGLVALLPLLLPSPHGHAVGNTSVATTTLPEPPDPITAVRRFGPRAKLLSVAAGLVLLGGTLAGVAAAGASDSTTTTEVAAPRATTTFGSDGPVAPSESASPSASASASPSASPSESASPSASASPSTSPFASPNPTPTKKPTVAPPMTTPPTTPPTTPTTSAPPPPTLRVLRLSVSTTCGSRSYEVVARITVEHNGAASGTVTVAWYASGSRLPASTVPITIPKGAKTPFTTTVSAPSTSGSWSARVSSNPAAESGQGSTSGPVNTSYCVILT